MFFLCDSFRLEHICGSFPSTFKFARCRDSSQPAKEGIHFSQTLAGLLKEVAGLEYMAFFDSFRGFFASQLGDFAI